MIDKFVIHLGAFASARVERLSSDVTRTARNHFLKFLAFSASPGVGCEVCFVLLLLCWSDSREQERANDMFYGNTREKKRREKRASNRRKHKSFDSPGYSRADKLRFRLYALSLSVYISPSLMWAYFVHNDNAFSLEKDWIKARVCDRSRCIGLSGRKF